jgi:hypothetical protein
MVHDKKMTEILSKCAHPLFQHYSCNVNVEVWKIPNNKVNGKVKV